MMEKLRSVGSFLWELIGEFFADDCPRRAAALSYYSIFAMPPLLGLMALVANQFIEPGQLREFISEQVQTWVGVESAARIVTVVEGAVRPELGGPTAVVGLILLLFGATASFVQLQDSLNAAWGVQPDPRRSDIRNFLVKRAISILMIASLGVLLLFSILASTLVALFHQILSGIGPEWMQSRALPLLDLSVSFVAVTMVFTIILKYVPDAVVLWREAIVGGIFTGALFTVGKLLIGYYLGRNEPGSVYGAAGSLAIAMLWIYYSSIILLLGAEFTEVWACRNGKPVVPQRGAVRVRRQVVYAEGKDEGREVKPEPDGEERESG